MSLPKIIVVKESLSELRALQRKSGELIGKRLRILMELKKHEKKGISKRELAKITGINHNTITKWRNLYLKYGIDAVLKHGRVGFKKPIITKSHLKAIEKKLSDPKNGLRGYKELHQWVKENLNLDIKYNTLYKYTVRQLKSKIKVARKSHIHKDEALVMEFKKNSIRSVPSLLKKQKKNTKT